MNLPYRTRIMLQRIGLIALTIAVFAALAWFCWVVWLERYVVYGRDGKATLNFDLPEQAQTCLLYTSPSPRDRQKSRMPSSA